VLHKRFEILATLLSRVSWNVVRASHLSHEYNASESWPSLTQGRLLMSMASKLLHSFGAPGAALLLGGMPPTLNQSLTDAMLDPVCKLQPQPTTHNPPNNPKPQPPATNPQPTIPNALVTNFVEKETANMIFLSSRRLLVDWVMLPPPYSLRS